MPKKALVPYWERLEKRFPKIAALHTEKTAAREILRVQVADRFIQHPTSQSPAEADKIARNEPFSARVLKRTKAYKQTSKRIASISAS